MYILYGGRFTRALIVEMVMAEGDIEYELREVDIVNNEHRSPEFLAINPTGFVPALITPQGETLYETPAFSLYLAEQHDLTHLAPRIDEPERGIFLSGFFYLAGEIEPALKRYFYPRRYVMREQDTQAMKQQAFDMAFDRFKVAERRLQDHGPYYLGERFSLVDLAMIYWIACIESGPILESCPGLKHCAELVMQRPRLKTMLDALQRISQEYAELQARSKGVK